MNSYEVMGQIGEGAFGKIFLVREAGGDRRCCVIKQIDLRKLSVRDKEASKKEVALLSRMKHPNIVSFITSFQDLTSLFIVMEFCDDGDLMKKIQQQRGLHFTEEQIVSWFLQICLGLKHIHDRKILHRDVKTQNIFLTSGGSKAKLGDFGIARTLNNTMDWARTCVGTPFYLSPEICQNRPYNNKTDIWSLGCVLYELCTLRHPFEGRSLPQLLSQICRGRYSPVSTRYSSELRLLLTQLFKVNPRDRPSITSVLKRPFLETLIHTHLEPQVMQQEFGQKLQPNRAKEKIQRSRGAHPGPGPCSGSRPGVGVKVSVTNPRPRPEWRFSRPAQKQPLRPRAAEVKGQHNHRPNLHPPPPPVRLDHQKQLDTPPHRHHQEDKPEPPAAPVEPYLLVAAARQQYMQRRQEANQNKLRVEKQLGLRPCTAEVKGRPEGHQERREEGQEQYLRQLDVIRRQYRQEMMEMRRRAAQVEKPDHGTFVVERDELSSEAAQNFSAALRLVTDEQKTQQDKRGIMFEIRFDGDDVRDAGMKGGGRGEKDEGDEGDEEGGDEEERDGEEKGDKEEAESEQRRGWSLRPPQTLLDHLSNLEVKSVYDSMVHEEPGRKQWGDGAPYTLLEALAQAELTSSSLNSQTSETQQEPVHQEEDSDLEMEEEPQQEPVDQEDSDLDTEEELQESRSDDDDTNFEESEDELREAVADSMRNLFIMDHSSSEEEDPQVHDGKETLDLQQVLTQFQGPHDADSSEPEGNGGGLTSPSQPT